MFTCTTCSIYTNGSFIITGYENNGIYILDQGKNALFTTRPMTRKEHSIEQETTKGPKNEFSKGSKVLNKEISDISILQQQRKRNSDSIHMWHRRFAHMNLTALRKSLKNTIHLSEG
jgi:hypothetical protein